MSGYVCAGLTGGIASGKSTVSEHFASMGAYIVDADEISRHALDAGTPCYKAVVNAFGKEILFPSGDIDRNKLGNIIFNDTEKRKLLNGLVHPYVRREMDLLSKAAYEEDRSRLVIWDVPLLLENGLYHQVKRVIVVTAPEEVRIARMEKRNGYSRQEALARIHSQMPDDVKCRLADYVINNDGDRASLYAQVKRVYGKLMQDFWAE